MRLLAIVSAVLIPIAAASGQKPAMKITGADRSHWSFVPLRKVTPPSTTGGGWARTPVDRFLAARHAVAGIHPNKVADRRVLNGLQLIVPRRAVLMRAPARHELRWTHQAAHMVDMCASTAIQFSHRVPPPPFAPVSPDPSPARWRH